MKRFALFEFDIYYPGGGFNDFVESFASAEDAVAYYRMPRPRGDRKYDCYPSDRFQVIDLKTGEEVARD